MARILITGSSDGLGSRVAQQLVANGHHVVVHGRNAQRTHDATTACPGAEAAVTGDLSSIAETKALAAQVNQLGAVDCIVHNAGLLHVPYSKTADGVPALAAVNILAPYVLTCLVHRPKRVVFLSSEMHRLATDRALDDVLWTRRGEAQWRNQTAYGESKLHNILFAKAFARRWPDVQSNALDPGWVPTKMGGSGATDSIDAAVQAYVWLAEGTDPHAQSSGQYFHPTKKAGSPLQVADDEKAQDRLLHVCAEATGVPLP